MKGNRFTCRWEKGRVIFTGLIEEENKKEKEEEKKGEVQYGAGGVRGGGRGRGEEETALPDEMVCNCLFSFGITDYFDSRKKVRDPLPKKVLYTSVNSRIIILTISGICGPTDVHT